MSRNKTLNFDAETWHGHISIRALSIEARGLLTDMASIMDHQNNLRFVTGDHITSANLANFAGIDVETVLALLEELKSTGMVKIAEDGLMHVAKVLFAHKRSGARVPVPAGNTEPTEDTGNAEG